MPFIYKDTKKKPMFVILITFSPSCNIQSYFINSLNQKHFPQYISLSPPHHENLPSIVQGMRRTTQSSAPVLKCKTLNCRGLTHVSKLIQWYKNKK